MSLLSKFFSKAPSDYLAKGDKLLGQQRFFEARTAFEEGLEKLGRYGGEQSLAGIFKDKIIGANIALAKLNLSEAEHAISAGANAKALDHLQLAKTLTDDKTLREKAEKLINDVTNISNETGKLETTSGCNSCSHTVPRMQVEPFCQDSDLPAMEYYDLLIRQLPDEMYNRYAKLGEEFACAYVSASRDEHQTALDLLEQCCGEVPKDIYCYEKGMIFCRLGKAQQAEKLLLESLAADVSNPLSHLGLALLLIDNGRLQEADSQLIAMIEAGIFSDQALFLRGNISEMEHDLDGAIEKYGRLLGTGYARSAAERLFGVLNDIGRTADAQAVFKNYLKGCRH